MQKKISRIFSWILIILGSFLEIYYYQYRFSNDGTHWLLAWIIGFTLTLLLSISIFIRDKKWTKWLIIPLFIYSVICTSAGQSFSLNIFENKKIELSAKDEYKKDEILGKAYRIKTIDEEIKAKVKFINTHAYWKKTRAEYTERIRELEKERKGLSQELSLLRRTTKTKKKSKKSENIYIFYNRLTGVPANWLQFLLHTILSIFIAVCAPIGIITITKKEENAVEEEKAHVVEVDNPIIKAEEEITKRDVFLFVYYSWTGARVRNDKKICPMHSFLQVMENKKIDFSIEKYKRLKKICVSEGLIHDDGTVIVKTQRQIEEKILKNI